MTWEVIPGWLWWDGHLSPAPMPLSTSAFSGMIQDVFGLWLILTIHLICTICWSWLTWLCPCASCRSFPRLCSLELLHLSKECIRDCCQWVVHCTTDWLGLGFGKFQTLASAHVLHLPTIEVGVFHAKLGVKVWGLVDSAVCQSLVLSVKSKVWVPDERVARRLAFGTEVISWTPKVITKIRVNWSGDRQFLLKLIDSG